MFARFTQEAREVVVCAEREARTRRREHIGTEHLLLGLSTRRRCAPRSRGL